MNKKLATTVVTSLALLGLLTGCASNTIIEPTPTVPSTSETPTETEGKATFKTVESIINASIAKAESSGLTETAILDGMIEPNIRVLEAGKDGRQAYYVGDAQNYHENHGAETFNYLRDGLSTATATYAYEGKDLVVKVNNEDGTISVLTLTVQDGIITKYEVVTGEVKNASVTFEYSVTPAGKAILDNQN